MNKTVLVTGVNGGIGVSLARKFKEAGWTVIGVDIKGKSNKYCELFINTDISKPQSIQIAYKKIRPKYESLSCLIHNAAIQIEKPLLKTTSKEWTKVFRTNVESIFSITKVFIALLDNSSIINISSVHARATSKGLAAYVASKGAVSALTRAMALELAEKGIRVNAILPGAIDTPMLEKSFAREKDQQKAKKILISSTPLRKIGNPDDVAKLALFLADSSLSGNVTGQEFICDGGVLSKLACE